MPTILNFSERLLAWYDQHGRKSLPWHRYQTAYPIWLSEIMLQQTQVTTVIPYFERFIATFPNVESLADAPIDDVLHLWSGLGYYARGRNLHKAAQMVVSRHNGVFPSSQEELEMLPGIGRSTAAAIRAQAFGQSAAILDGNVKRFLARLTALNVWPGSTEGQKTLWALSEQLLANERLRDYTQAIMDFGSVLCRRSRPLCEECPFRQECMSFQQNIVEQVPVSKKRKPIPTREIFFLIIIDAEGKIKLEQRPPVGIWGGLWSFPELPFGELQTGLTNLGWNMASVDLEILPAGEHVFSHFRLHYHPVILRNGMPNNIEEGAQQVWYDANKDMRLGLPVPVEKLLAQLALSQG